MRKRQFIKKYGKKEWRRHTAGLTELHKTLLDQLDVLVKTPVKERNKKTYVQQKIFVVNKIAEVETKLIQLE